MLEEGVVTGERTTNYGIKTYRYLRISMASLVVCLLASVVTEHFTNPESCWQGSLSAYYYTPARPIFVASLFAIGVCMVVLLGYPPLQDVLLNVGGFLAIIVTLVPTPNKGNCMSVPFQLEERGVNVHNNMTAFFVGAAIAMAVTVATAFSEDGFRGFGKNPWPEGTAEKIRVGGILLEALLLVGGAIWFFAFANHFDRNAHWVAASVLCLTIIAIVTLNSREALREGKKTYARIYRLLAGAMAVTVVVVPLVKVATGWGHAILVTEVVLIALFGVFWGIQTKDLWDEEVRSTVGAGAITEGSR